MNSSCQEFSEQVWVEYVDGLTIPQQQRLRDHLSECALCSEQMAELRAWREKLAVEGARLREVLSQPVLDMEKMLTESLTRIAAAPKHVSRLERIARLRALLEPVFGAGTMRAAIDSASSKISEDEVGLQSWSVFVHAVSETIRGVCGLAAGILTERAGLSLLSAEAARS